MRAFAGSDDALGWAHWMKTSGIGFAAGFAGQLTIYPLDTAKTRLQNQGVKRLYNNTFDAVIKIVRNEGFFALYRGVLAVAMLTSPEKSLKLGVNDYMRWRLKQDDNTVSLGEEAIAGATAGFAQVVITCPMERYKILLQQQSGISPLQVLRQIGFKGMYRGATATWMRDIPFSVIYFPMYHVLKGKLYATHENGEALAPWELLVVATAAGTAAAIAVTPADCIKTRVQTTDLYKGTLDAIVKTYKNEGFGAFWKGLTARIITRGPQFGVTIMCYELLQRFFGDGESTSDFSLKKQQQDKD